MQGSRKRFFHRNGRQVGKHLFHRNHRCVSFPEGSFYLRNLFRFLQRKTIHTGTEQAAHHPAAAQTFSNIVTEGTDIGSFGTYHPNADSGQFHGKNFQRMYRNRPSFPFHFLSFPCQLIQPLSVHLAGGIHGWKLFIDPLKGHNRPLCFFFCYSNFFFRKNASCHILGICHNTQQKFCHILLFLIRQHAAEFRAVPQAYGQYAFRLRIQCACMADFFLFENPPQSGYNVVGCVSLLFIYIDNAADHCLHHSSSWSCFSICKDRLLTTSWNVPAIVQPAAFLWPPPPK